MPTEEQVRDALRKVKDPDLHRDIVSLGFVQDIAIEDGRVSCTINLTTPACPVRDKLKEEAREALLELPGVREAQVTMKAEVRAAAFSSRTGVQGVKNIVAVGSGKGGVGKSTVACNLAVALAQTGARVGLLDGDIYGPTQTMMMGGESKIAFTEEKEILPAKAHGVSFMSMGFLAPRDKPLIWRGPMAHKAFHETLFNVQWGDLDYLIVDLPPGTGDVHLTLVQSVQVAGGVLVTTPQDVGLTISMKTLRMFQSAQVRILGLVENMSYYRCPSCGAVEKIFGKGNCAEVAEQLGVPYLGAIPLDASICEQSDRGEPIVVSREKGEIARAYREMAEKLAAQVSVASFAPKLEIIEEPA